MAVLYDPDAPAGSRMSTLASSGIHRCVSEPRQQPESYQKVAVGQDRNHADLLRVHGSYFVRSCMMQLPVTVALYPGAGQPPGPCIKQRPMGHSCCLPAVYCFKP